MKVIVTNSYDESCAVVAGMTNRSQNAGGGCFPPPPAQIILAHHFVVFAFRLSPLPHRDGAARLCGGRQNGKRGSHQ